MALQAMNKIQWCQKFQNTTRSMNMQLFQWKDARLKLYDSMSMAVQSDTYKAFWGRRAHDNDWYCFSEVQGSDWNLCLILKRSLSAISDPRFSSFFLKVVWPFLQSFCAFFRVSLICEACLYIMEWIRVENLVSIFLHQCLDSWFDSLWISFQK